MTTILASAVLRAWGESEAQQKMTKVIGPNWRIQGGTALSQPYALLFDIHFSFIRGSANPCISNFQSFISLLFMNYIYKLRECFIRGSVDDQEPHVAEGDFRRRRMWRHLESGREVSVLSIRYALSTSSSSLLLSLLLND